MSLYERKPLKLLFTYPPTWMAVAAIFTVHILYTILFTPSLIWTIAAAVLDVAGFGLWGYLSFKSKAFQDHFNRMPYEDRNREILELLRSCPDTFRKPAEECISLLARINKEFPDQTYSAELGMMMANLRELSENHKILHERFLQFGNQEQKKRMESILAGQLEALKATLATLKTFSGNLTLLAVNEEQTQVATDELKYINQGLKEVIEEL
ncbi:MAG: hypothetical protein JW904_06510 [Spirochaetales bacterium]|nr:hypothetical protein [Spirochaetales bacterium]